MSDMTVKTQNPSLLVKSKGAGMTSSKDANPVIVRVAREFGVSPVKQLCDIVVGNLSARKVRPNEYYDLKLFDSALTAEEKSAFLGQRGGYVLNHRLNPLQSTPLRHLTNNKLLYTELLAKLGIATTETQAFISTTTYAGERVSLRTADEICDFLRIRAQYPLFGKPFDGTLSVGSVRILGCDGDYVTYANGERAKVSELANEIMQKYADGYLLQSALETHEDLAVMAGPSTACVRVVTVNTGQKIEPIYALWKLPAPKAMSDNFWQAGSLLAAVDLSDGKIAAARRGTGLETEWFETHPDTGAPLAGRHLPMWQETLELATNAHRLFPEFGVFGFDIGVTPSGPVIVESNDSPAHMLYQLAHGKGIMSQPFAQTFSEIIDGQKRRHAQYMSAEKKDLKRRGITH